jgi:photosystem II stability/assembly factor-like uncharacterized protein
MGWADAEVGYVVGGKGLILTTRDGGRNWIRREAPRDADLHSIVTVTKDEAWVVGDGGRILTTSTGGLTWRQVDLGIGEDLSSLAFEDGAIWIVGDGSLWILPRDHQSE